MGITVYHFQKVLIKENIHNLDVGLRFPFIVAIKIGKSVRLLIPHMI